MPPVVHNFVEAFVPLFVAIDVVGLLPLFVAFTTGLSERQRRGLGIQAVLVALAIMLGFMFLGNLIFSLLGITIADFQIAGGILLLILAMLDLVSFGKPAVHDVQIVGLVPLAMPLIAGPAALTTTLVLAHRSDLGYGYTAGALIVNCVILLAVLLSSTAIVRIVGANTLRASSKLVMVLLAAIAVNYIRSGVTFILRHP
jgi:multiple antibiotic resistance protein